MNENGDRSEIGDLVLTAFGFAVMSFQRFQVCRRRVEKELTGMLRETPRRR
jgi:hypothetical protein